MNEEWNDDVLEHDARIGHLPLENDAIPPRAPAVAHESEIHAAVPSVVSQPLEIRTMCCPRDEARRCQRIDPEPSWRWRRRLRGVRADDLEITGTANRNQSVSRSAPDVLSANGRAHAEARFKLCARRVDVGRRVHEMIDLIHDLGCHDC